MSDSSSRLEGFDPVDTKARLQGLSGVGDPFPGLSNEEVRVISPQKMETLKMQAGFKDITGRVFGRLTVVGLDEKSPAKGKPRSWIVRCSCGRHEKMKRKTIMIAQKDRCESCTFAQAARTGDRMHRWDRSPKNTSVEKPNQLPKWVKLFSRQCPDLVPEKSINPKGDLTGGSFGALLVVGKSTEHKDRSSGSAMWVCACNCGAGLFVVRPYRELQKAVPMPCPVCDNKNKAEAKKLERRRASILPEYREDEEDNASPSL